jgi:copper chaperone NosL
MNLLKACILTLLLTTLISCNKGPEKINYSNELCDHCKMTISDPRFAAEIVTQKGKVYKYDAIECMFEGQELIGITDEEVYGYYVNDFTNPGEFIEGKTAVYIQSESIPSPMGMYLSAYATKEEAGKVLDDNPGSMLTFAEARERVSNNLKP